MMMMIIGLLECFSYHYTSDTLQADTNEELTYNSNQFLNHFFTTSKGCNSLPEVSISVNYYCLLTIFFTKDVYRIYIFCTIGFLKVLHHYGITHMYDCKSTF